MLFGFLGGGKSKGDRKAAAKQAFREFAEKEAAFQVEYDRICACDVLFLLIPEKAYHDL